MPVVDVYQFRQHTPTVHLFQVGDPVAELVSDTQYTTYLGYGLAAVGLVLAAIVFGLVACRRMSGIGRYESRRQHKAGSNSGSNSGGSAATAAGAAAASKAQASATLATNGQVSHSVAAEASQQQLQQQQQQQRLSYTGNSVTANETSLSSNGSSCNNGHVVAPQNNGGYHGHVGTAPRLQRPQPPPAPSAAATAAAAAPSSSSSSFAPQPFEDALASVRARVTPRAGGASSVWSDAIRAPKELWLV